MKKLFLFIFLMISCIAFAVNDDHKLSISANCGLNIFDGDVSQTYKDIYPTAFTDITYGCELDYSLSHIGGLSVDYFYVPLNANVGNYLSIRTIFNNINLNGYLNFTDLIYPDKNYKLLVLGYAGVGYARYDFNTTFIPYNKLGNLNQATIYGPLQYQPTPIKYGLAATFPISLAVEYPILSNFNLGCKLRYVYTNKDNLEGLLYQYAVVDNNTVVPIRTVYKGVSNDGVGMCVLYLRYNFKSKHSKFVDIKKKIYTPDIKDKNCCGDTYITNNYINTNIYNGCKTCNDSTIYANNNGINDDFVNKIPSVYFDFDKYNLDNDALNIIKHIAAIMRKYPDYNVEIRGYCDYIGNIPYNEKLSVNRVNIVKSELINVYNIPEQHIIGNGLGKIDSPKMRYRINRRCDFFFFK